MLGFHFLDTRKKLSCSRFQLLKDFKYNKKANKYKFHY